MFKYRIQRSELGYLVHGDKLDSGDPINPELTSIRSLASRHPQVPFDDLLRGDSGSSFGDLLQTNGFQAIPSPAYRGPAGQV